MWFDISPDTPATTDVYARLDTLDAQGLDETISDLATTLGRLGDTSPVDTRRATALGMLADPQQVLDLDVDTPLRPAGTPTLFLHVDADHLDKGTPGSIEKLGPATLALIADWLERVGKVHIQPVLDMASTEAVDRHDPPEWMQTLVVLRDTHCVFPGCRTDARSCDLDHIAPYQEHGPPGQTSPANLAPLCRRHHNQKTHHGWHYTREPDGYRWLSPLGQEHLVPHLN
ncbi:MAG: HNH endonuclease [Nocardioidaceae bacterium]|nr:HNH endonuclease [Nocardioidaceae bacterium]